MSLSCFWVLNILVFDERIRKQCENSSSFHSLWSLADSSYVGEDGFNSHPKQLNWKLVISIPLLVLNLIQNDQLEVESSYQFFVSGHFLGIFMA